VIWLSSHFPRKIFFDGLGGLGGTTKSREMKSFIHLFEMVLMGYGGAMLFLPSICLSFWLNDLCIDLYRNFLKMKNENENENFRKIFIPEMSLKVT
jgi:hypothetical protein